MERAGGSGGGRLCFGVSRHVLLDEDLHQVDVAAGGRGMQGRPQLVVLGVHVCAMGEKQLDDFLKVVDATLEKTQRRSEPRQARATVATWPAPHKQPREEISGSRTSDPGTHILEKTPNNQDSPKSPAADPAGP